MSLNYSLLPMLVDDGVRTVAVRFINDNGCLSGKSYTYLTKGEFEVGDYAVVLVSKTPKVVQVKEMDVPTRDDVDYKWIVCKVNMAPYKENLENCVELAKEVRKLEQENQRAQLKEALGLTSLKAIAFQ